jgi:hypothetical protein
LCSEAEVPLGCNVGGICDYCISMAMNNAVKNARYPFGSPNTPWDQKNGTVDGMYTNFNLVKLLVQNIKILCIRSNVT